MIVLTCNIYFSSFYGETKEKQNSRAGSQDSGRRLQRDLDGEVHVVKGRLRSAEGRDDESGI